MTDYATEDALQVPEHLILQDLAADIRGCSMLDLGVGCGRTTPHLLALSTDYVGIDYSPEMIACCRRRFPGVRFEVGDARSLDAFREGSFDFVFFSFNGIDYVDHDGRLQVLNEVRRLLRPGGTFAFSSHVLGTTVRSPFWGSSAFSWHPLRLARFGVHKAVGIVRHLRRRRYEVRAGDYEIRNDSGSNFSLLTYYVRVEAQFAQLEAAGFTDIRTVDLEGYMRRQPSATTAPWIYYVAQKLRPSTLNAPAR